MRYPSIDILRTVALFVMVFVHFGENLSGVIMPFAGLGAPLFAFLSGVSYCLWAKGQQARGKSELEISKVSVRRGLFVFGVGFAFNILVWLPEDTFNWDVLTFIGVALIVLNFARKLPLSISTFAGVLVLCMSPVLRAAADYGAYWENSYFDHDGTLSDILIGFLSTGYFPIFPWLTFSFAGFVTASKLFTEPEEGATNSDSEPDLPPSPWPVAMFGGALMAASLLFLQARSYLPTTIADGLLGQWTMFPPTTVYVLGTLGMALLLLALAHRWVDRNPSMLKRQHALNIAKTFSRHSFTIYIAHHVVHLWPLWIYGTLNGDEPTQYWMQAMPLALSLPLAVLFMACCYVLFRWLGPERNYGIESWMRWVCD